jgi:hypothetical protein
MIGLFVFRIFNPFNRIILKPILITIRLYLKDSFSSKATLD